MASMNYFLSNAPFEGMSGNLSLIFDHPVICKTVEEIDQSDNITDLVLDFNTLICVRLIDDWSVEYMNFRVILYVMSLDGSVSPKQNELKQPSIEF